MADARIGFIGAGQMGRALARGFVTAGLTDAELIFASDPDAAALERFVQDVPGSQLVETNARLVQDVDLIFLAVKPQTMRAVSDSLREARKQDRLFVSIVAGIPIGQLCIALDTQRIIRVMPNTPCLVGRGASAYALGPGASAEDGAVIGRYLRAVGIAIELDELHLDAVTGLSGSGPAYVYQVIEAMSDGGVRAGLPRDVARQLAAHTVRGAAEMVIQTGEHPAVLKDKVTSPGGTTIAGLEALEKGGLRTALISAIQAATQRSRELGT